MALHRYLIVHYFLVFTFFKVAGNGYFSVTECKKKKKLQPCMVSIQKDQIHVCGGILIQNQWGLTSAHCKEKPITSVTRVGILIYEFPETFNVRIRQDDIMLIKQNLKKIPKKEKDFPPGTKYMLCAGSMQEKRGTCYYIGDSGGPLECKKNLVGVVSGSRGCGVATQTYCVHFFFCERHIRWINTILNSTTV
uniref:Peptidase S1 domain-containing protein n=1 Tax=Sinocyclocheilus anshuiensis TaxID=1608454 RepID=A0A671M852_9TELE